MAKEKIKINEVSKIYDIHTVKALQNINLTVNTGETIALMGHSGCGKSTLLNLIGGIDKPSLGNIIIDDQNLSDLSEQALTKLRQTKIGFIFQFFNLLNNLTVLENILLPTALANQDKTKSKQKALELLNQVGMIEREKFYPAQLSGGQMQRVAIARALIHQPEIILADEPTGNLDSENGKQIMSLLTELSRQKKTTMIIATHSNDIAKYAQKKLLIKDGHLITPTVE